jgi:hypothetical protein
MIFAALTFSIRLFNWRFFLSLTPSNYAQRFWRRWGVLKIMDISEEYLYRENREGTQKEINWFRKNSTCLLLVFLTFLFGILLLGWQSWQSSNYAEEVRKEISEKNGKLQKEKIKILLMSALIEVQREQFNLALIDTNRFFNSLKNEIEKNEESAYFIEEKISLKKLFERRDTTIVSIARRETESFEKLLDIYLSYQKIIGESRRGEKVEPKSKKTPEEKESNSNAVISENSNQEEQNMSLESNTKVSNNSNTINAGNETSANVNE